jgi:Alternative complex III, ActD subunit
MSDQITLIALFSEIDPAVNAIDKLREMGITDQNLEVISGIPISHKIMGRPLVKTFIPKLALGGAIVGLLTAAFLMFGTPYLFELNVGGQPLYPLPPFYVAAFELSMLGLMGTAFIGLFLAGKFPTFEPKIYVPEISDGKIGLAFTCHEENQEKFEEAMTSVGAEKVRGVEEKQL